MTGQPEPRYAIYYTPPPGHPLARAGSHWLRRNGSELPLHAGGGDNDAHLKLVQEPRRYGFHATLKAPFRLKQGFAAADLERAIETFAAASLPCPIGPLRVDTLGGFFALVPQRPIPTLRGFASRIVEEFDRYRAPMNRNELQRRIRNPLDEAETTNLVQWGYPYVFERFRFHMTLTGRVPAEERSRAHCQLEEVFLPYLDEDYHIDALTLFVQDRPDADFVVSSRFPLRPRAIMNEAG